MYPSLPPSSRNSQCEKETAPSLAEHLTRSVILFPLSLNGDWISRVLISNCSMNKARLQSLRDTNAQCHSGFQLVKFDILAVKREIGMVECIRRSSLRQKTDVCFFMFNQQSLYEAFLDIVIAELGNTMVLVQPFFCL